VRSVECAGCGTLFAFDPTYPRKKFHDPSCSRRVKNAARKDAGNGARDKAREDHDVQFIAVDGEGVTRWGWEEEYDWETNDFVAVRAKVHDYVLLSVGDQSLHRDGERLTHEEIFTFLYDQKRDNPKAVFVGFFLGYDFSQWLKTMPKSRGDSLFHPYGVQQRMPANPEMKYPFPVFVDGWDIDILGMKRFKLRPHVKRSDFPQCQTNHKTPELIEECFTGAHNKHPNPWMYINDAGAFFQTSLMMAINPKKWAPGTAVVTDEEMAILQAGKDDRSTAQFGPEMIRYNILENDVLSRLMRTVNEGFVADGIKLKADQWYGPGQAAQAWMGIIGAPKGDDIREVMPQWAEDAARFSYYGGWFETFMSGVLPGTTYGYDINSAYPYEISRLPCLLHGEWSQGTGNPGRLKKGNYRLVKAHIKGSDPYIGTMPHRDAFGGISHPRETIGWHWVSEIDAARRAGLIDTVKVIEWVEYSPCGCPPPYAAIEDLYEGRLRVGKETPYGKAKKLVYNSSYGKMAQSIGMPKYANAVYASLITSGCRRMILDAIALHPEKGKAVAMIATDGIYFTTPNPNLDIHPTRLGAFGEEPHENLSILMPGLYWDDEARELIRENKAPKLKSRGVSGKYLAPFMEEFDRQWSVLLEKATETGTFYPTDAAPKASIVVEFSVISPRLAVHRNRWDQCGQVVWDDDRVISANPKAKRGMFYTEGDGILRTLVRKTVDREHICRDKAGNPKCDAGLHSHPYENLFGGFDAEAELEAEEALREYLTQDGTINDLVHAVVSS
jgi:hypothetical protein